MSGKKGVWVRWLTKTHLNVNKNTKLFGNTPFISILGVKYCLNNVKIIKHPFISTLGVKNIV